MQKENQRVIISKRMLKEGLLRLLEKKNIDKINVSELCQESGTDFSSVDAMDSEDLKLMATYLAGGGYYVLRRWHMEDIQKTPDEIAALMLKLFKNDLLLPR